YSTPQQYIEEINNASPQNRDVTRTSTSSLLQVLNDLAYTLPGGHTNNAAYTTLQRKSTNMPKMLQVLNNLTYSTPQQYIEEINNVSSQNRNVTRTSTNNLLQVLNHLAYMLPAENVNNATYTTLQRKSTNMRKMLQVVNNLTYSTPQQYVEEINNASPQNRNVTRTSTNSLLQMLNHLAYMLPANHTRNVTYTMLPRKNASMRNMLHVGNHLTYQQHMENTPEISRQGSHQNKLLQVLSNISHMIPKQGNTVLQRRSATPNMLYALNHFTYKTPQTDNHAYYPTNSKMLSERLVSLRDRVANQFTQLHNKYFFTANNPLSHRIYVNHESEVKPLNTSSSHQRLQYKRRETIPKYIAVQREQLPLKYKENPQKQIIEEKKKPQKNQRTTHIHVSDTKINSIATRVYKILEKKMSIEKNRRGIF
ncbi:hypothetical protein, partial [Candidatus Uabimicrobium amorphum]